MKYFDIFLKFATGILVYILLSLTNLFIFKLILYVAAIYLIINCIKFFIYEIDENEYFDKIDILKNIFAFYGGLSIFILQIFSIEFTVYTLIILLGFVFLSFSIILLQNQNKDKKNYIYLIISSIILIFSLIFNLGKGINLLVIFANSNLLIPTIIIFIGLNILLKE